ncbi:MAG: sarcosine oxidase subunit delta [Alphaproteobacteria bacterium]|nr:sarcosine oxidase subunit delta [Alphaproteobacteria bacterium]
MFLIPCPFCGQRNEEEFVSGGEARRRPDDPASLDDAAWADHLFNRDNTKGVVREWWWHARGCRLWFMVERDTLNQAISPAEKPP